MISCQVALKCTIDCNRRQPHPVPLKLNFAKRITPGEICRSTTCIGSVMGVSVFSDRSTTRLFVMVTKNFSTASTQRRKLSSIFRHFTRKLSEKWVEYSAKTSSPIKTSLQLSVRRAYTRIRTYRKSAPKMKTLLDARMLLLQLVWQQMSSLLAPTTKKKVQRWRVRWCWYEMGKQLTIRET